MSTIKITHHISKDELIASTMLILQEDIEGNEISRKKIEEVLRNQMRWSGSSWINDARTEGYGDSAQLEEACDKAERIVEQLYPEFK